MWPRLRRSGSMRVWRRTPVRVVEAGIGVGERVPGDHQDGAADRDDGAWSRGAAPLPLAEEGVGLRHPRPDAAPHAGEPGPKTPPSPAKLADLAIDNPSFLQAARPMSAIDS